MLALPLSDDALQVGSVLDGRYRIDGVIGGGGMARVYHAEHLGISRPVAIKVLHAGLSRSREAVARFQREATTSGKLVHPNIVAVTDSGTLPDGRCFLVMEALDGETLADRLDREDRLPWRVAVSLMGELLLGLRHAHAHGVIHRDIKPENIFIVGGDAKPLVKILDFGIAKLHASMQEGSRLTQDGLTIGTPMYMSPEQAVDGEITPASDLYSSTVVLFEMLTGDPPFYSSDAIATMKAHLHEPPPSVREYVPELDVPHELEEIIRRGLAKQLVDRIPSADSYLKLLDQLRVAGILQLRGLRRATTPPAGEPIATPPALPAPPPPALPAPPPPALLAPPRVRERDTDIDVASQAQLPPRRRRLAVGGTLTLAGIAILVAYQALGSPRDPRAVTPPAPVVAASEPAPEAPAPAPILPVAAPAAVLPVAAPAAVLPVAAPAPPGDSARPARDKRAPLAGPGSSVGSTPAPAAERSRDREQVKRWVTEGDLALAAGRFEAAGAQFQRALAADATAHAAHAGLAEVAYNRGDFPRAVLAARRAVSLAPKIAAYRMTLAKAHYKLLRYDDAIAQWQKALALDPSKDRARKNIELARSKMGGGALTSGAATGSPR